MQNPYSRIGPAQSRIAADWAARNFATGSTFRMFKKGESSKIREFLKKRVNDGRELAKLDESRYDEEINGLVRQIQRRFRCNKRMHHRRPNFGQAAKVVNLYIKALLLLPHYILRFDKTNLEKHAHVILDGIVLDLIWGRYPSEVYFRNELKKKSFRKPQLRSLKKKQYFIIQRLLRTAASGQKIPPIAFDFFWALERQKQ
jgi:hypothetical protein